MAFVIWWPLLFGGHTLLLAFLLSAHEENDEFSLHNNDSASYFLWAPFRFTYTYIYAPTAVFEAFLPATGILFVLCKLNYMPV